MAAVPAIGTPAGHKLFSSKAQAAAAAVASYDVDVDFVDKHQEGRSPAALRVLLEGKHADAAPVSPMVFKAHASCGLGKQRVILTQPNVDSG